MERRFFKRLFQINIFLKALHTSFNGPSAFCTIKIVADNLRFTFLPTSIFYYWGEIDPSSCRARYWYFYDQVYRGPYCDVDENGQLYYTKKLGPWDTYHVEGLGQGDFRANYECVVYPDSQRDWALSRDTWNENR